MSGSDPRLSPRLEAQSWIRRAEHVGGHGMVLHSGDADRGAITILIACRGVHHACIERQLAMAGDYCWKHVGPPEGSRANILSEWISRRVRMDGDCWVIELDVPDPERFIAETTASG